MGKSKSQTSSSKTESSPWAPAQDQLKDILSEAQKEYEKTGGLDGNWIDKNYPDLTDEMKSALTNMAQSGNLQNVADQVNNISAGAAGNVNDASAALKGMTSGGITSDQINDMASDLYDNELVDSQTGQLNKNVTQQLNSQVNALNQQAAGSGNMGSSRAGVAQGVMAGKASDAVATGSAAIQNQARQSAYQQAQGTLQGNQQTNLNAANSLGSLGMNQGQLQAGNSSIYQQMLGNQFNAANVGQTQAQNSALNDYFNQYGKSQAGWGNLQNYLNMVGSVGGMGGTSNGTTTQSGGGGSMFNNILGAASTGAGIYGSIMNSDKDLKKDIKKVGKSKSGSNVYEWNWNKKAEKEVGEKGSGRGVLAQEEAKKNPDAVMKNPKTGTLMVDYSKTDVVPSKSSKKKSKKRK